MRLEGPKRLEGEVAIITGGNSGIGRATAEAMAREGAAVVIAARNEKTSRDDDDVFFEIGQRQYGAGAFLAWGDLRNPVFRVGPMVRFIDSRSTNDDSLLAIESPYGFDEFGQLGIQAHFAYDSRRDLPTLSSGFDVDSTATYYPKVWDVEDDYGVLEGTATGHIQVARPVTVALLFGGKKAWGEFPYFDAAYLGGGGRLQRVQLEPLRG